MEQIAVGFPLPRRGGSKSESSEISQPSNSSRSPTTLAPCSRPDFARAIAALVALKRTADLTPPEVEAWFAVLGGFPAEIVNAAVLEVALTKDRFPEVGDLYAICRRSLPKPYVPAGDPDQGRPTRREIAAVAGRLGLRVAR